MRISKILISHLHEASRVYCYCCRTKRSAWWLSCPTKSMVWPRWSINSRKFPLHVIPALPKRTSAKSGCICPNSRPSPSWTLEIHCLKRYVAMFHGWSINSFHRYLIRNYHLLVSDGSFWAVQQYRQLQWHFGRTCEDRQSRAKGFHWS